MELVVGLLVLAVILYLLFGGAGKKPNTAKPPYISEEEKILSENSGWMDERWALARKERDVGELRSVPRWFFDDVTEQQLQKIGEIGLKIGGGRPTKGEASDIIGLFEPVEVENIEILKFFKIPLKGMNQSRARHEVSKLFHDPDKLQSWRNRPAYPMQKEFYKFFALKAPQDLTHEVAARCINEYRKKLGQEDEAKMDEWDAYEDIYEQINEPEFREDYELKKISLSLYRSAIAQLKNEEKTLTELYDDVDQVVDKLLEMKPDIQRTESS